MQLDIGAHDLAFALGAATMPGPGQGPLSRDDALVCLSVRSAFDLWLRAMAFSPGEEIVMSAVTLPDMARVVRAHGLVPVPVDLDPQTMAPRAADVARAVTPRTRAIVIAHLFGALVRLDRIAEVAARAGVPLVEDAAQALSGDGSLGDPRADVTLLSFGPIKTATALGGAVARVRDPEILRRMVCIAARDPQQQRRAFALRALKYAALAALTRPAVYGAAVALLDAAGRDGAAELKRLSRGFSAGDLLGAIRRRPSWPLRRLLARRFEQPIASRVAARAERGAWLLELLAEHVEVPGRAANRPTFWLFPIAVEDPDALRRELLAAGFDAARGTTSLAALDAPAGREAPVRAQALMRRLVYVPIPPEASAAELGALAATINRAATPLCAAAPRADSLSVPHVRVA